MGKGLDALQVKPFTAEGVPNPYPGGVLPWQTYHTVRNALVQTCRRFGPTGPMGVIQIIRDVEDPYRMLARAPGFWERGDPDPRYFLLDDQLNHERYCYAELYGEEPLTANWLLAIAETLRQFGGWGLVVSNIPDSYLLIFGKRLLVKGRLAKRQTAGAVVDEAGRLLRRGPKRWWQFWR